MIVPQAPEGPGLPVRHPLPVRPPRRYAEALAVGQLDPQLQTALPVPLAGLNLRFLPVQRVSPAHDPHRPGPGIANWISLIHFRSGDRFDPVRVFEFVRAHQGQYPIACMCRVLDVSTSGYHAWRRRPPSRRAQANAALSRRIERIHAESRQTYGARRVHAELQAEGESVSRPRVARLMRALGLAGVTRRKRRCTTRRDPQAAVAPDRVKRRFEASEPNRLWVADITYVPTLEGFLYLATVLDVFSRKVVGWAMGARQTVELVRAGLEMALQTRAARGVVLHSDQGSQYTALAFSRRCAEAGIERSMGAAGNCYDNAMAESLFATLECELLQRVPFATREQAAMEIFVFLESFYNRKRRHSALGYRSPVEFEQAWQAQQAAA